MKRVVTGLCVVVLLCGVVYGQTPGPNYEQLKCFDQLIGTWVYDGPLWEDIPGVATKDTKAVFRISYAWILNKNAIEAEWSMELAGGTKVAGKGLTGWDAAGQRIVGGGVTSAGGYDLSTSSYDAATKTWTIKGEGTDAEGKAFTSTLVLTLSDSDTLVAQAIERTGGSIQGEGPKITLTRAAASRRPTPVKQPAGTELEPAKKSKSGE